MKDSELHGNRLLLLCILVTITIALLLDLGSFQLGFEEPRRALVALEMLLRNNGIVPTTNGSLYFNKPPLYNWFLIFLFKIFGSEEWVVRLPTVFSVIGTGLVHYFFTKGHLGKVPALLSALFYITCADIFFYFSYLGEIDLFYAFLVYLQAISIFYFYEKKSFVLLFIVSYLLTAAGVLTKGIPSIVFQGISLSIIFIINKDVKRLFSVAHLLGIVAFMLCCGGYFFAYSKYYPVQPYLARLFTETFSRSAIENSARTNFGHLLRFPLMLIKISTPWCLLFLIPSSYKRFFNENRFLKFCFWFVLANISIYWISPGARDRYLYMFFPFILSCLAYGIVKSDFKYKAIWLRRFCRYIGIIVSVGLVALAYFSFSRNLNWAAVTCVGLSIASVVLLLRQYEPLKFLFTLVLLISFGRIGFDMAILPTKKQDDPYKVDAKKMSRIIGDEKIFLVGKPEKTTDTVRFSGLEFATFRRDEPTFLSFQTSFYLSKYTGSVVTYTSDLNKAGFYISTEEHASRWPIKTFYRFRNRENLWYILFKFDDKRKK